MRVTLKPDSCPGVTTASGLASRGKKRPDIKPDRGVLKDVRGARSRWNLSGIAGAVAPTMNDNRTVRKRVTGVWHVGLATLAVVVLSGCRSNESKQQSQGFPSGPSAVLAAARASHITMFGELPNERGSIFVSRPVTALQQHTFGDVGADFDVDISPKGDAMVFASTRHSVNPDLYIKAISGVAVTQLTSDAAADVQPVFSPDGSRVAFASNRSGNWDIWIMAVNGGMPVRVTQSGADEIHPSWSPDGTELVFCSMPEYGGQWELWVADAFNGSARRFIGYGLFPDWSPTGNDIVYQRARERGGRWFSIWKLTMVDGEPRYPTELASSATEAMILPAWSHDGRRIAFATTSAEPDGSILPGGGQPNNHREGDRESTSRGIAFDIWTIGADGSGKVRLTDGHSVNYGPAFGPDGRVYFTSTRAGFENVWSVWSENDPALTPNADHITGMAPPDDGAVSRADGRATRGDH